MPLRMVAIHGSARRHGNSRTLMDEALAAAKELRHDLEVEVVRAYDSDVNPCIDCRRCNEDHAGCSVGGDGWHRLEDLLRSADVLLIATPVYFMGPPAPVKAIIDRLQAMWWYRERGGKVATNDGPFRRGGLIMVAAGEGTTFKPSRRIALAALNTLGFELTAELMAGSLEDPTDAAERSDLIERARDLGSLLVG